MCFAVSVSSSPWVTPLQFCSVSPATSFYILLQPLPSLPFEFQPVQGLVWGSDLFSSSQEEEEGGNSFFFSGMEWKEHFTLRQCSIILLLWSWRSLQPVIFLPLMYVSLLSSGLLVLITKPFLCLQEKILSESVLLLQFYLLLIHLIPLSLWSMKSEGQGSQHMLFRN